ncbi:hypothetical protein EDC14_101646 [Hydrogenispora ethanolica]|uniref:Uncharacterized protein n=1 Tax=Hydrogenispora ethanolica TaxID=1082276 RepID=A0A4R1RIU4_HYDET|nr:hypothetical protein EDC14_101646 [Hydrogenispora ethanolica]
MKLRKELQALYATYRPLALPSFVVKKQMICTFESDYTDTRWSSKE